MLERLLRGLIERAARLYRGGEYSLDSDLPLRSLAGTAARRATALLRYALRGLARSFDPRDWGFLGPDVELRNRPQIRFGRSVTLGRGVVIDGLSREGVHLGDGVSIGPYSILEATGVVTNLGKGIHIGARSGMGAYSFVGGAGGVWIGEDVIMGQRMSFHSEDHVYDRPEIPIRLQGVTRKGIRVDDDCWIGANVTFLDGAQVGRGCVIGAGAVVRGEIPPFSVAVGVPAKVVKNRKAPSP